MYRLAYFTYFPPCYEGICELHHLWIITQYIGSFDFFIIASQKAFATPMIFLFSPQLASGLQYSSCWEHKSTAIRVLMFATQDRNSTELLR